jgi:hypothetical protein
MLNNILKMIETLKGKMDELAQMKEKLEAIKDMLCTAIIVEPRKHRAMEFVLRNALDNLDSRWSIRIFCSGQNEKWLEELLEKSFQKDLERISWKRLEFSNLGSSLEYNQILASREFTEAIPTETFLVFQTDSMINPAHKGLLEKFMKYDFESFVSIRIPVIRNPESTKNISTPSHPP